MRRSWIGVLALAMLAPAAAAGQTSTPWPGVPAGARVRMTHRCPGEGDLVFEGRFVSSDRVAARLRVDDRGGRTWALADQRHVTVASERAINDSIEVALPWAELLLTEVGEPVSSSVGFRVLRSTLTGGLAGAIAGTLVGIGISSSTRNLAAPPVRTDVAPSGLPASEMNAAWAGYGTVIGIAIGALVGLGSGDELRWRPVSPPSLR